ncbi:tyrosine-type recombinase/integrase [Aquirufa nivalisilvae]
MTKIASPRKFIAEINAIHDHILNQEKMADKPKKIYPYKLCVIRDYDKSLDKTWHVEYYVWEINEKKLYRRRVTLNQKRAKDRYAYAKEVIDQIDPLLKMGKAYDKYAAVETSTLSENLNINSINCFSTIKEATRNYLAFHKTILSPRTLQSYTSDVKRLTNYLNKNSLEKVSLEKFTDVQAMRFLDDLVYVNKISNRSRNNTKGTISTIFNFYKKRKVITQNPFEGIEKLPHLSTRHAAYTKTQIADFKKECIYRGEHQLLLFVQFIYFAFLRPRFELRLLKIEDIKEKTIRVPAENAKNNATEHVMIPSALEKIIQEAKLRDYPESYFVFGDDGLPGPIALGKEHFYNKHKAILKRINLDGHNFDTYSWKHSGAIALFQATQNIELLRQQCRHSDLATTQKYLRDLGLFIDYDQINKFPEF